MNYLPLSIEQDCDRGVVTIEGMKYAFELFQQFGVVTVGQVLRIDKREDGVLTFTVVRREGTA
jgi:hypothetical protein